MKTDRESVIVRTSMIGIAANAVLAAFKATVGLLSNSIAIVMDAVNNLSDALSSVITIIGTRLAGKEPDKQHPYGYGRVEYLSETLIAILVLYAGITSLVESVKAIITPAEPDYSPVSLIIVAAAVVVKLLLGSFVKKTGEKVNSESLVDSGTDAMMDSIISAATLVAAGIYLLWHVSVEPYLAAVISIVIIRSGLGMLKETISRILGERVDPALAKEVKNIVRSNEEVLGAYDLFLHNYGPDAYQGSIHVEVPDTMDSQGIDHLTRRIQHDVFAKTGVILAAIGIYSSNTADPKAAEARKKIHDIVFKHEHILEMHGFYMDEAAKTISFDIVAEFEAGDRSALRDQIVKEVNALYPDYQIVTTLDIDVSD